MSSTIAIGPCVALLFGSLLVACDDGRMDPPDAGRTGPEGGVLAFDAAMLRRDAGGSSAVDAAPPPADVGVTRRDAGTEYECTGLAESCFDQRSSVSCIGVFGCDWESDCTGVSRSCGGYFSSYTCGRQRGCYWSSYDERCTGFPRSCSSLAGYQCTSQDGCYLNERCTGVRRSCRDIVTEGLCRSQPGCSWERVP